MNQQLGPLLYTISVWALPAIIAITFHEAAHGFVARLLGDDTAWRLGRVTFNPLKHIDPVGTILLPGLLLFLHSPFLFGYAKSVPINFRALHTPRRDMVLVAAAGPGMNIFLALIAAIGFYLVGYLPDTAAQWLAENLKNALIINVVLAVFNLLPLPPLDRGANRRGTAPKSARCPACRAGALRNDDPDRGSFHPADDRCAIRDQSQRGLPIDLRRDGYGHWDHFVDNGPHLEHPAAGDRLRTSLCRREPR
jgi:Zn-dependent protease